MERKTLSLLLTVLLGFQLLIAPALVYSQTEPTEPPQVPDYCVLRRDPARVGITNCGAVGSDCYYSTNELCGICCIASTVLYVTDIIFTAMVIMVVLFVLLGAFNILTAAGNADKVNKGRDYILYAAIGLAVALLAKAVPWLVRFLVAPT